MFCPYLLCQENDWEWIVTGKESKCRAEIKEPESKCWAEIKRTGIKMPDREKDRKQLGIE